MRSAACLATDYTIYTEVLTEAGLLHGSLPRQLAAVQAVAPVAELLVPRVTQEGPGGKSGFTGHVWPFPVVLPVPGGVSVVAAAPPHGASCRSPIGKQHLLWIKCLSQEGGDLLSTPWS